MKKKPSIPVLLLVALMLAACAQQVKAVEDKAPQDGGTEATCPEPTDDTRLLKSARHGYCLLYPIEYKVEKPNQNQTALVIGGILNAEDPCVHIRVEDAAGRTAEAVADQVGADFGEGIPGFSVERSSATLNGVKAIVLDKLPGQEMNRRLFAVHDGRLYQFMFWPVDENLGDAYTRMEALYDMVVSSFTFIPPSDVVVPGEECLEAKADTLFLTNEAHNYCLLYPDGYDVGQPNENETVLFVGSLLDVAHPEAFIKVQDAAGRTAGQIADELAAEVETSMPGYSVERTFGVTVGYEPAVVLENMPGQDLSRQVIFVHDGRFYKLTFVPASADAGDVYTQMESLYTTVVNSFRFLR